MQSYGYDRHVLPLLSSTFLLPPSQMTFFFCIPACLAARASPPAVRRRDSAFRLPVFLILFLIIKTIYRQVVPPVLICSLVPLLLLDPLESSSNGFTACSLASRLANHPLSGLGCHPIPSTLSSLSDHCFHFSISAVCTSTEVVY